MSHPLIANGLMHIYIYLCMYTVSNTYIYMTCKYIYIYRFDISWHRKSSPTHSVAIGSWLAHIHFLEKQPQ